MFDTDRIKFKGPVVYTNPSIGAYYIFYLEKFQWTLSDHLKYEDYFRNVNILQ